MRESESMFRNALKEVSDASAGYVDVQQRLDTLCGLDPANCAATPELVVECCATGVAKVASNGRMARTVGSLSEGEVVRARRPSPLIDITHAHRELAAATAGYAGVAKYANSFDPDDDS